MIKQTKEKPNGKMITSVEVYDEEYLKMVL